MCAYWERGVCAHWEGDVTKGSGCFDRDLDKSGQGHHQRSQTETLINQRAQLGVQLLRESGIWTTGSL